jgi:hypothetical protein
MADIFISYAKEDRDKARELARLLEERHWTVWWDRQIEIGQSFDKVIERELRACSCAIVLWTTLSLESDWVRGEARSAARRHILVPILAEDVEPPLEFSALQAADLTTWTDVATHAEFQKVVRRIEQLTAASHSGSTQPPRVRHPVAGSDSIRRASAHEESRRWSSSKRIAGVAVVIVVALAGGTLYWTAPSAPAPASTPPTSTPQSSPETQSPGPAATDSPKAPVASTGTPPRQSAAKPQVSQGKAAPVPQPPASTTSKSREAEPPQSIASKTGRDPEPPPDQPRVRKVDLPGFNLSINQANYFNSKEFEIDDLDLARDFLIDFDIRSTRGGGSTRYGIAWNFQPDDFLLFTLHSIGSGYYSIGPGRSRSYRPFSRYSEGFIAINAERDFDVIQFKRRGDELIFSVNRREVWRTTEFRVLSKRFAFWVADSTDAVIRSYAVQQ